MCAKINSLTRPMPKQNHACCVSWKKYVTWRKKVCNCTRFKTKSLLVLNYSHTPLKVKQSTPYTCWSLLGLRIMCIKGICSLVTFESWLTLDWHLDWHSVNIPINTQSALDKQSIDSSRRPSVDSLMHAQLPTDWVSIKCQSRCWGSIDHLLIGYQSRVIQGYRVDQWQWLTLYCNT